MKKQIDLFAIDNRHIQLSKKGDPLERLNSVMNWEIFSDLLQKVRQKGDRKSNAGRKPFDNLVMFKMLILQTLYKLSDAQLEYQTKDRLSFARFLGLELTDIVPDEKTVWLFREELKNSGLMDELFKRFDEYLSNRGYKAELGTIVDATIVEVPRQRNAEK